LTVLTVRRRDIPPPLFKEIEMLHLSRQRTRRSIAIVALSAMAMALLCGCASRAAEAPRDGSAKNGPEALRLQRVVMLMRHSVRPPTKPYVIPEGYASDPWPEW